MSKYTNDNSDSLDTANGYAFGSDVVPDVDNTRSIGNTIKQWRNLFIDGIGYFTGTTNQLVIGTAPDITTINFPAAAEGATITFPNVTDTIVTRNATETLTNKTLTSPTINTPVIKNTAGSTISVPNGASATFVADNYTQTLQNKSFTVDNGACAFVNWNDITKKATFNLSGKTASTTSTFSLSGGLQTITVPTGDLTLATTNTNQTISGVNTYTGAQTFTGTTNVETLNRTGGNLSITTTTSGNISLTAGGTGVILTNNEIRCPTATAQRKLVLYSSTTNDYQYLGFGVSPGSLDYMTAAVGDNHVFWYGTSTTTRTEIARFETTTNDLVINTGGIRFGSSNPSLNVYTGEVAYTPTMGDGANFFTLTTASGRYYRIGGIVHFTVNCVWTSKGAVGAGNPVRITLPYTIGANWRRAGFAIGYMNGVTYSGTLSAGGNASLNYIQLYQSTEAGVGGSLPCSSLLGSGEVQISGTFSL